MRRKSVSGVSDGVGEIVSQKVDYITTVVQPFVYTQVDRNQSKTVGLEKMLTKCAEVLLVYQCGVSVVHSLPGPNLVDNRIITPTIQ
jgi:hypothetical protein